jgi:hypothetical protein
MTATVPTVPPVALDDAPVSLQQLIKTSINGQRGIFIAEDALTLGEKGLLAVRSADACAYAAYFTDALVFALPGYDEQVVSALASDGAKVMVVELPEFGKRCSLSRWLDDGHGKDQLKQAVAAARLWKPAAPDPAVAVAAEAPQPVVETARRTASLSLKASEHPKERVSRNGSGHGDDEREPTTWAPVDLTSALAGDDVEPPSLLQRSDGLPLLYRGRTHAFQGESESCKSWAAQFAVKQTIDAGENVLYIDFEDDAAGVVARLRSLGLAVENIAARFVYIRPDEPLCGQKGQATPAGSDLLTACEDRGPFALAIVDGVTEAMTTEGLALIDNADIAAWMRRLPRRLARMGAAVVVLDHLPKDRMSQGRYALGGQHKLAGLTGAAYKFTLTRYFSRATRLDPVDGRVVISVEKDRPGYVRARATEEKVGEFRLTSYPDGGVSLSVEPVDRAQSVDRKVVDRILEHLAVYDGSSKNAIEQAVEGRASTVREALSWLTEQGWISVERKGNTHLHWLTDTGRSEITARSAPDEDRS